MIWHKVGETEVEVEFELKKGRSNHKKKYFRRLKGLWGKKKWKKINLIPYEDCVDFKEKVKKKKVEMKKKWLILFPSFHDNTKYWDSDSFW